MDAKGYSKMKATEIIRGVLDLIDDVESENSSTQDTSPEQTSVLSILPLSKDAEEINRYKQIVDLLPNESDDLSPFSNTPNPKVASITAVTTQSGDDLHKSKHPSDIRANSLSMYPFHQHDPREEK